ncbi:MAG: hypothetical protein ABIN48_12235 [Ginsengibacter sp.]
MSILKLGSKEDAKLLLGSFLKNPTDFDHTCLLSLFKKFGDLDFAERIFNSVIVENRLIEDADPSILNLLGQLKYEPIKEILFQYVFSKNNPDYTLQTYSVLGLLHFDCSEYVDEIKLNINSCFNKNLFPEFIPALVCKLPDNDQVLEQLYLLGDNYASTDCNAGIILGFSLCGEQGKKYFKKALYNPNWETHSGSTGTLKFTYEAMKNLNISFSELYTDIKQISDLAELKYALYVLFSLFSKRVGDYEDENMDRFKSLYQIFYSWENPNKSNNLIDLAEKVNEVEEAYKYENLFESKMTEEFIIENCSH